MATSRRGNPVARAGNYVQEVDSTGMDPLMKASLFGTKPDKTEANFLKNAKNKKTATEAIRRARRANKQPPLAE